LITLASPAAVDGEEVVVVGLRERLGARRTGDRDFVADVQLRGPRGGQTAGVDDEIQVQLAAGVPAYGVFAAAWWRMRPVEHQVLIGDREAQRAVRIGEDHPDVVVELIGVDDALWILRDGDVAVVGLEDADLDDLGRFGIGPSGSASARYRRR
jgi:hypothetical protein